MLTLEVIEREIKNIIDHGNNYEDCARLANLYICRAGMTGKKIEIADPGPALPVNDDSSEFMKAASCVPACECFAVIDELMTVLRAINPRLYSGVLRKLDVDRG